MRYSFFFATRTTIHQLFYASLFLLLFTSTVYAKSESCTIYALIAVDTKSNLKNSVLEDSKKMNLLFDAIKATGVEVKKTNLKDENLTVHNLKLWLKELPVSSEDIIFFYFSGHGVRTRESKAPWPILVFQHGSEFVEGAQIKEVLSRKKARLTVMITDCCNGFALPKGPFKNVDTLLDGNKYGKKLVENLTRLFSKSKGHIFLTASEPGTNAIGFVSYGGLLTNCLLSSIVSQSEKDVSTDWKLVLNEVRTGCKQFNQNPFYEVKIRTKKR